MKTNRRTTSADESRDFFLALARVLEHYLPDERTHYRHCSQVSRRQHIYRDLRTLQRTLERWMRAAK